MRADELLENCSDFHGDGLEVLSRMRSLDDVGDWRGADHSSWPEEIKVQNSRSINRMLAVSIRAIQQLQGVIQEMEERVEELEAQLVAKEK